MLRPSSFGEFTGQEKVVENLKIFVQAAKKRGEPLDHVLLHGPPGLGKTTLSYIIANELGLNIKISSGPVMDKPSDLAGILTNLEENDVLFIDEIHRLNPVVEEYLYSAMEDYRIDILLETGPNARSVQLKLNPFTLIGATTRAGLLTSPLRARFGINSRLNIIMPIFSETSSIGRRKFSMFLSMRMQLANSPGGAGVPPGSPIISYGGPGILPTSKERE